MVRRAQTSLQVKLILAFMVVMLIPTGAISAYNLLRTRSVLLSRISAEQLRVAEARAAAAESRIAEGGADLLFIVQAPAMRQFARGEPDAVDAVATTFQDFLRQSIGRYSGICLLNTDGQELACVRNNGSGFERTPATELVSRKDAPIFLDALRQAGIPDGRPIAINGAGPNDAPDTLSYSLLYPGASGAGAGVIVLEAPLGPILKVLVDADPSVSSYVIDADGSFLLLPEDAGASSADPRQTLADLQPNDAQTILRQSAGTIIGSRDRPLSFQVFTRVQPPGQSSVHWTVVYEQPLNRLIGEVETSQLVIVAITVGGMLLALALAQLLTAELLRPVRALAAAAERIGADDLGAPIPAEGLDEVGALGRSLDRTVARLRATLEAAERRRYEAETLRAATQALGTTLDRDRVLALILSELRKVVPFDSASVQELSGDTATIIGTYGMVQASAVMGAQFSLVAEASPNAQVARSRAPVILADGPAVYELFKREPYNVDPIRSWLGVPMIFGERLVGLITLDKHEPGYFTPEHGRLATAFAAQAAAAMENARLYEDARRELADRRLVEAAHGRLAAIIEATTDLVSMADLTGRILFLNQAGRRMLALGDDEAEIGTRVIELYPQRLHGLLRNEAIPTAVSEGAWSGEMVILARDGVEIPVSQVIIAHKGADGKPEFLSTIVRDMRERRRAEEELRQAQKMEALGRLAGGMAHDFNNLLTVILGEADMLLDEAPRGSEQAQSAEQIRQAGARAAALTRQLLAFSRRQVLQTELIDLSAVVGGMEQMLRRLLGEDIALGMRLTPNLALVRADPSQVEQVVMNLCINGRDAMPAGGRLSVETDEALLDAGYARQHPEVTPGAYAVLTVRDTGAGMDAQTKAHIFEPFFTTKARGKGTGLGLATVHGIVRQSGGHIWFASEPEQGSCFKIYLPTVAAEEVQTPEQGAAPPTKRTASETVLLVEDDDDVRSLARQILVREGYTVLEAADGHAAQTIAGAHSGSIHLLLTDVVMPGGLNGVQLAGALLARRPQLRVVYMSGYTDNALVDQSISESGARYLQKPFTPGELARLLAESLA